MDPHQQSQLLPLHPHHPLTNPNSDFSSLTSTTPTATNMDYHQLSSGLPPGLDPSLVDFREFYPYIPNEVKHRKRTTQAQLEVLEDTFCRDRKPSAAVRMALSKELDMSPRGVQVWFQNRRAKEKNLAKKNTVCIKRRLEDTVDPNLSGDPSSVGIDPTRASHDAHSSTAPANPISLNLSPSLEDSGSALNSAQSTLPAMSREFAHPRPPHLTDDLQSLRRGSLPAIMRSTSEDTARYLSTVDHMGRRSSFDTNIYRLAAHPYAYLAAQANGTAVYSRAPRHYSSTKSLPGGPDAQMYQQSSRLVDRAIMGHRASMPYLFSQSHNPDQGAQPSVSSRYHGGQYAIPSRVMQPMIPGPLPAPNFSFGASSSSPQTTSPDGNPGLGMGLNSYSFPLPSDRDPDEELTNTPCYDSFSSRFSSIASLASTSSSDASDLPPGGFEPESRRPSQASGQMLNHFSALELGAQTNPALLTSGPHFHEHNPVLEPTAEEMGNGNIAGDSPGATTTYPSPGSTASNGSSPPVHTISRSSELALALSPSGDAVKLESPESGGIDSPASRPPLHHSDSSPLLDPSNIFGNNGRSCYDTGYASHATYSIYGDPGSYPGDTGQYLVSPFGSHDHSPAQSDQGSSSDMLPGYNHTPPLASRLGHHP